MKKNKGGRIMPINIHYPGTNPDSLITVEVKCKSCGGDIRLIENGKPMPGNCKNPDCELHKIGIALKIIHLETIYYTMKPKQT